MVSLRRGIFRADNDWVDFRSPADWWPKDDSLDKTGFPFHKFDTGF
jgi:hypothetical protein